MFGNDGVVNDADPLPCDAGGKDHAYARVALEWIRADAATFDPAAVYAEGFSQNSMYAASFAFCFEREVVGVYQGGSGLALAGKAPTPPGKQVECTESSFRKHANQCVTNEPCGEKCQYWPIYPCFSETAPVIDCVVSYDDDFLYGSASHMNEALIREGHDSRLLVFTPDAAAGRDGGHKNPENYEHWLDGWLSRDHRAVHRQVRDWIQAVRVDFVEDGHA